MARDGVILRLNVAVWLLSVLVAMQLWPVLRTLEGFAVIVVVSVAAVLYWALHELDE